MRRRKILIVSPDRLGIRMAGPAIRAVNMALVLSAEHDVRIATWHRSEYSHPAFEVVHTPLDDQEASMLEQVGWSDLLILQGLALNVFACLHGTDRIVVCDLYDPFHLEQLEQARELEPAAWRQQVTGTTEALNEQLKRGDFFICANNRQRDFWLGQMAAWGRVNPDNYLADNTLDKLIALVPFGTEAEPPQPTAHAIKGVVPGIAPDDKVLIWAGGVYNWFDPQSLIAAVADVAQRHPTVRLFFLGMKHPNPDVPAMRSAAEAMALSDRLGLTGVHVFFNQQWVDYDERKNYLADADAGVTTHFEHLETRFSFRTRVLDYLWAGLPIITTRGDDFAELVQLRDLGAALPERDVPALVQAIEQVLYDPEIAARTKANVIALRPEFTWERVLQPLTEFCRNPLPAPDRLAPLWARATPGAPGAASPAVAPLTRRALRRLKRLVRGVVRRLRR